MTTKSKEGFNLAWLLIPGIAIILVIAAIAFLNGRDGYGQYAQLNGWELLKMEWPSFWKWVIIGIIGSIILGYLAYANENAKWPATKWPGYTGLTIIFCLLSAVALLGPWAKAVTDKTNSGVTAPGFSNHGMIPGKVDSGAQVTITQGDTSMIVIDNVDSQQLQAIRRITHGKKTDSTKY